MPFFPYCLLILSLIFLPLRGVAQDQTPPREAKIASLNLTLRDAIKMAIEQNLAIHVDAFGPDIARARTQEAAGVFDPELRGDLTQRTTRLGDGSEDRTGSASFGIGGLTPLGTDYDVRLHTTSFDYRGYRSGAAFAINQPLLRGFGTDVNLAGLRIARVNEESSQWGFRQQVIDVVSQTHVIYNELYAAIRQHDAARRSRDAARQLEADERARASIGVRIGLDVTSARAEAAAREEAVLLTRQRIEDNERYLKQLITRQVEALLATEVNITPPPTPALGRVDVEAGLRDAFTYRPDYRQAKLDLTIRKINVVTTRNATLPRLDLNASLALLGVTRRDAASTLDFGGGGARSPQDWSAGLVFSMPVPNRSARGRHDAARLLQAQALVELHRLEQAIIVEVANAAGNIETARKRIDTTREALELAQESLDAGNERLRAGSATAFEVLELQRKLTEAEASLIRAEADYRNAVTQFDRRTGTTLLRNRITITPGK